MCGEKCDIKNIVARAAGSPPRMRGKAFPPLGGVLYQGITPAYAGKSLSLMFCQKSTPDHPRVCGEKMMKAGSNCAMLGSPPRMRGKGFCGIKTHRHTGITPAYAGKRERNQLSRIKSWDHPRVCGEKHTLAIASGLTTGSPPRMRGKGKNANRTERAARITPAYAGKSILATVWVQSRRDHPRVCGEKRCA